MNTKDRQEAEIQTQILLEEALFEAVKLLYGHFSPEECWDIIQRTLQTQATNPHVRDETIRWIKAQLQHT